MTGTGSLTGTMAGTPRGGTTGKHVVFLLPGVQHCAECHCPVHCLQPGLPTWTASAAVEGCPEGYISMLHAALSVAAAANHGAAGVEGCVCGSIFVNLSVAPAAAGCVEDASWVPRNRSSIDSACCVLAGDSRTSCARICCQLGYPEG